MSLPKRIQKLYEEETKMLQIEIDQILNDLEYEKEYQEYLDRECLP